MTIHLPIIGTEDSYPLDPSKIIAVGLNYHDHIEESLSLKVRGLEGKKPEEPLIFNKTPNVLIASGEAIRLPLLQGKYPWADQARTDYEGELALVIGKTGKNIRPENALSHVYGYTCANDVSQRNIQNQDRTGWFRGKSFDSFGPVGPCLVPAEQLDKPGNLNLETRLNGRRVQQSNTAKMIFSIPDIIAYISAQFTLYQGDLILTGTPAGVGPLAVGDRVEVEIQGIGTLVNSVVQDSPGYSA